MATVSVSHESARGCGYRKGGGLYLVSGALSEPCPKLPVELHVCPTCGAGVKQARGFSWITPDPLLDPGPHGSKKHDAVCPLGTAIDWTEGKRAGLIWIGEKFYATPSEFSREAAAMGVSRRISTVPRDLVIGETWIALAHPRACDTHECEHGVRTIPGAECEACPEGLPVSVMRGGVFTFFRPTAIEYIVKGDETEEELDRLEERGFKLVRVVKVGEPTSFEDLDEEAV
jgi:hypothetical protein